MDETALATVDKFRQQLAQAEDIDTLRYYEARIAAILELVQRERRGIEEVNKAAEMLLWTRRELGRWLAEELEKNEGALSRGCTMQPRGDEPTYEELGIERTEAHRWQALYRIPEPDFVQKIEEVKQAGELLTFNAFYKLAKHQEAEQVDDDHPMSQTQVSSNLAYAMIFNAVEDGDWKWLLSEQCLFYMETLGLPREPIHSWALSKCPSMATTLHNYYDPIFERNGGKRV